MIYGRAIAGFFLLTTLSGCSLFPQPGEPAKKYTLSPLKQGSINAESSLFKKHNNQISIELPTVYSPLDNNRIALVPAERQIEYYADVEWGDRLSNLIQESLVYSLQNSGAFQSVTRTAESVHADYALKCDVRKFFIQSINKDRGSQAVVEYFVQIIKLPEREVIASHTFLHQEPVSVERLNNLVEALDNTQIGIVRKIVEWMHTVLP